MSSGSLETRDGGSASGNVRNQLIALDNAILATSTLRGRSNYELKCSN
jgi:hypothetical protein